MQIITKCSSWCGSQSRGKGSMWHIHTNSSPDGVRHGQRRAREGLLELDRKKDSIVSRCWEYMKNMYKISAFMVLPLQ